MNKALFKSFFLFKQYIHNGAFLKEISQTRKNLYLDRNDIVSLQLKKFKDLCSYAYNNSPFYAEKYKNAGVTPLDINNLHDLEKIPFITKSEIRDNLVRIIPSGIKDAWKVPVNTGGTTGVPMKLFWDKRKANLMSALYFRTLEMNGCRIGSKTVWIWGLKEGNENQDFRNQLPLKRWLKNISWFNGFDMTPEAMHEFCEFSFCFKPEILISYVSSLYEFSKFILENKLDIFPPNTIWITAEPSTKEQRETIERAFNAPVFSQYGSSEILHLATECNRHEGLHIHADSRIIEITDENGQKLPEGETGNVVITDLENFVTPLIRYKNDDIASTKPGFCSCGITLPLLNEVAGRVYNVFKLRSGKQIYGHMFSRIFFNYVNEIRQFQIHQKSHEKIDVYIVPGIISDRHSLQVELLNSMKYHTGSEVQYQFYWVDEIKKEKSGKLLYTKSDV
jgi:phenylacetate-CoA ligase